MEEGSKKIEIVHRSRCVGQGVQQVANCDKNCIKKRQDTTEPLLPTALPKHPRTLVGSDFFKFNGMWYIVLQDYYSRFWEMVKLNHLTSGAAIARLNNIFARHGIPLQMITDGGT